MIVEGLDNVILLDLDGVLITTKPWESDVLLEDGFADFKKKSVEKLNEIIAETGYDIVLSSARRYTTSIEEMNAIFKRRGINGTIREYLPLYDLNLRYNRYMEIILFLIKYRPINYLIIDDDKSLSRLNDYGIERWIKTDPMVGLI